MSITYQVRNNYHAAHLDAWDGCAVSSYGPCQTYLPNCGYSQSAQNASDTPALETLSYEPRQVYGYRTDPKDDQGVIWKLFAGQRLRMTDYQRGQITTTNSLVSVHKLGTHLSRFDSKERWSGSYGNCALGGSRVVTCEARNAAFDYSYWDEQGDLFKWQTLDQLNIITMSDFSNAAIQAAITGTREAVALKSYRDYDALTDLFQLPSMVKDIKGGFSNFYSVIRKMQSKFSEGHLIAASRLRPRDLLSKKNVVDALARIADVWMTYRYSVMTTMYSLRDIHKFIQHKELIKDKSHRVIDPVTYNPSLPTSYIRKDTTGTVTVRSMVASLYSTDTLVTLDRLSFNPFSTAWELIPYSWIADWFCNFGDYILAATTMDWSQQRLACTSVRTNKLETYTLHWGGQDNIPAGSYGIRNSNTCWPNDINHPAVQTQVAEGVLRTVETDTYSRTVFSPYNVVSFHLADGLNAKRVMDSLSLIINRVKNGTVGYRSVRH